MKPQRIRHDRSGIIPDVKIFQHHEKPGIGIGSLRIACSSAGDLDINIRYRSGAPAQKRQAVMRLNDAVFIRPRKITGSAGLHDAPDLFDKPFGIFGVLVDLVANNNIETGGNERKLLRITSDKRGVFSFRRPDVLVHIDPDTEAGSRHEVLQNKTTGASYIE